MKKSIAALLTVILMISLAACRAKGGYDAYKEIYKRYGSMESFYAAAEITVRNDRTENTYKVRQTYKAPDTYEIVFDSPEEIAGSGYSFRDGKVFLKSGFEHGESLGIYSPNERHTVFLTDFFSEYYKSEDSSAAASGGSLESTTVLKCFISNGGENRFSQNLWIDNKTFLPVKLETYDSGGNPTVTVKYTEFKRNCDTDNSIF